MMGGIPNGWFLEGLLWWGETLQREVWVSKGFVIDCPDLSEASSGCRNAVKTMIMAFHGAMGDDYHCQWRWSVNNDYDEAIDRYAGVTDSIRSRSSRWCRFNRMDRTDRYNKKMDEGGLRRERLEVFLSHKIDARAPISNFRQYLQEEFLQRIIEQEHVGFAHKLDVMRGLFSDTEITPMGDLEHFRAIRRFCNPSLLDGDASEMGIELDTGLSIQENCFRGDYGKHPECGMRGDDVYMNVLTVTRWPKSTRPGVFRPLTGVQFLTYDVTINIHPLPVRKEIEKEEKMIERIQGDFVSEQKYSLLTALRKKEAKVDALAEGFTLPYEVLYLVRVWDADLDKLVGKTNAIKNAISAMGGAQYYETTMFTQAKKLWAQTWPGWLGGRYKYRNIYAEHEYLSDMIPFSSTFTGQLENAEAIYDGASDNLVGVRMFNGDTPQHAVLFGMSGSGKSAFMCDLLSQTSGFYDYTVLVEEGLSYGIYTATEGCKPIVLRPDGDITINYLDTHGMPLTALQRSAAASLALCMVGVSDSGDTNNHRSAMLAEYIGQLYDDVARDWLKKDAGRANAALQTAYAIEQWRQAKMPIGTSYLEGYCDFRDMAEKDGGLIRDWAGQFGEAEIIKWSKTDVGDSTLINHVFSMLDPEEFPQHAALVEMLMYGTMGHHDQKEVNYIASALSAWQASGGTYGKLFDGVTNVDMTGRVAHFELGLIPESAKELKTAAGFLITNFARQHIVTLPRGAKKRIVFEEVARFLDVPGGEKIVSESYAQLRKFSCVVLSIIQQYERFRQSSIRSVVIANSKTYFMMRQNDTQDIEEIAKDIQLTEATKATIRAYPLPEQQSDGNRYSSLTYVSEDANGQICGTLRHYCSPEMLYCSSSNGELFDRRAKALKAHDDVCEGIFSEVDTMEEERVRKAAVEAAQPALSRRRKLGKI
jgi:hypothetical protein